MNKRPLDALLLFILLIARIRIDTLAGLVAPRSVDQLEKIALLPVASLRLLEDWLVDPYSLILITLAFAGLLAYLIVDQFSDRWGVATTYRVKLGLIYAIVLVTVVAQSVTLIALRHVTGPASFTHDGGVIQTEEAAKFIEQGKNPYVEDYTQTPLADWGADLKTALYHFPYMPWTFLSAVPFQLAGQILFGWYDQRFVYLLLFLLMLWLAPKLCSDRTDSLILTMILGLNPIMASDVIFGQNDSFVLFWLVLFAYGLVRRRWTLSGVALGLAIASKSTAWFIVPFYLAYLWQHSERPSVALRRLAPTAVVAGVLILPFAVWNFGAMIDDIWRWSAGAIPTAYQIRGWGFANAVLALNLVSSRLDYFPFWIPELCIGVPVLVGLLWRQIKYDNSPAAMFWGYAVFSFVFLYFSRFLNENYLGYLLACLALGYCVSARAPDGQNRIASDAAGAGATRQ